MLEQYKERLHQRGDEGHDEELDYIKQILASPIFYDYVQNSSQLSQEETSIFSEVTNDLLSGFQETTDGKMSPAEKHKQRVQRKRSLKALRNVVNSPRIKPRRPHGAGGANSSDGGKASSSVYDHGTPPLATSPPDRGPGPPSSSTSGSRFENSPSTTTSGSIATVVNGKQVQDFTPLTGRNVVDQDYTPVMGLSNGVLDFDTPSSGPLTFESPSRNLSNSTGTLIERSTSPSSDDTLLRRSDENLLANGGTPSSDGNLLHRLKTEGGATTSAYAIGNGTGPNSIPSLGGMDWDLSPTKQPQQQQLLPSSSIHDPGPPPPSTQGALKLKLAPMNVAHRQPPSYQLHMQQQQNHTTTTAPHHQIVTSPQVENKRPPPPPYGQAGGNLMPQRRAKSFDRLLDSSPSDGAIPIHLPPLNHQAPDTTTNIADLAPFTQQQQQPQVISGGGGLTPSSNYGNPIVRPMTDGMVTTNYLTAAERRRTILTVRLEKGEKGLGFRVNGLKSKQYGGGLFVQDLQPGGIAER